MILTAQFFTDDWEPIEGLTGTNELEIKGKFMVDGRSKHLGKFLIVTEHQPDEATTRDLQAMLLRKGRAK